MSFFSDLFNKIPDVLTGGMTSGLGGLFSSLFQGNSQARQQRYSKELMDYQAAIQRQQQDYLLRNQMPLQVASMKAAGLNPNTVNGLSSAITAPTPSATSSTPSPYQMNIANDILALKQSEVVDSEINLKNKEAAYYEDLSSKTRSETDLLDKQNVVFFDNLQKQWDNLITNSELNRSNTMLANEKRREVEESINKMKVEENKLMSEIATNMANVEFTKKQAKYYDNYIMSVIKQNFASAQLALGTDTREAEMQVFNMVNSDALTSYYKSQSNLFEANEKMAEYTLKLDKKYGNADRVVNIVSRVLGSAGSIVGGALGAFFGAKKGKGLSVPSGANGALRSGRSVTLNPNGSYSYDIR